MLLVFAIQGRTVVVFARFFKILSSFSFWSWRSFSSFFCWDSIWNFIICANISLRSSIFFFFLDFKENFYSKKSFFFSEEIEFDTKEATKEHRKVILKGKEENILWNSYHLWNDVSILKNVIGMRFFFKYPLSDTFRCLYNLIPCSCLTKILFDSLYAGTLL